EANSIDDAVNNGIKYLGSAVALHVADAIESLSTISAEVVEKATEVLLKMEICARRVALGEITPKTGEIAVQNYLHALEFYQKAAQNKAHVEAYTRAISMLELSKSALFSALRLAVSAAVPVADSAFDGLSKVAEDLRKK